MAAICYGLPRTNTFSARDLRMRPPLYLCAHQCNGRAPASSSTFTHHHGTPTRRISPPPPPWPGACTAAPSLNLLHFTGHHQGIGLGELLLGLGAVVKITRVLLGVAVCRAERVTAAAFETEQADAFLALPAERVIGLHRTRRCGGGVCRCARRRGFLRRQACRRRRGRGLGNRCRICRNRRRRLHFRHRFLGSRRCGVGAANLPGRRGAAILTPATASALILGPARSVVVSETLAAHVQRLRPPVKSASRRTRYR